MLVRMDSSGCQRRQGFKIEPKDLQRVSCAAGGKVKVMQMTWGQCSCRSDRVGICVDLLSLKCYGNRRVSRDQRLRSYMQGMSIFCRGLKFRVEWNAKTRRLKSVTKHS